MARLNTEQRTYVGGGEKAGVTRIGFGGRRADRERVATAFGVLPKARGVKARHESRTSGDSGPHRCQQCSSGWPGTQASL